MQISMWVPYDENRLRRTIQFVLRPQLRWRRIAGAGLTALGLALAVMDPSMVTAYEIAALGLIVVFAFGPITVARTMRRLSSVTKDGFHLALDDKLVTVTYPLIESRFQWAALDRVIETPDVWYLMIGKIQALTIPKGQMTEQQRVEFSAFVNARQPV